MNGDKISYIEVTNPGKNYKTAPEVVINGSIQDGGKEAQATAVMGRGKARGVKLLANLTEYPHALHFKCEEIETFVGTGAQQIFHRNGPLQLMQIRYK